MLDFLRSILNRFSVALYLLAVVLLLLAALIPDNDFETFPANILLVFGGGIFITTLVSSILNFYFQQEIDRRFAIVAGAEASGIRRVYADRKAAMAEINSEFEKARGKVELLGISGTDWFQPQLPVLDQLNSMCRNNSNIDVRILLLDPRSKHAIDRTLIEESIDLATENIKNVAYATKKLCEDVLLSMRQLEAVLDDKEKRGRDHFNIEVRTYDTAPMLFFVRVNDRLFVEQYHYGITEEEEQTNLTKCLGKKMPVLELRSQSSAAELVGSHFDYMWKTSETRRVAPGSAEWLGDDLRAGAWLSVWEKTEKIVVAHLGSFKDLT